MLSNTILQQKIWLQSFSLAWIDHVNAVSVLIGCVYRQFSRFQLCLLEQRMASREQSLFFDEIGSLSIYNTDGSENVTQKANSRYLKLLRPYPI